MSHVGGGARWLALALLAFGAPGILAACGGSSGAGSSDRLAAACEKPLPASKPRTLTAQDFANAETDLGAMAARAQQGDVNFAARFFFGGGLSGVNSITLHDFMHLVDAPLRNVDQPLGERLCEAVLTFENEFVQKNPRHDVIASASNRSADILKQAAKELHPPQA